MNRTKMITIGSLLICLTVLFQIIPVVFSEIFIFATILSALPIYIISRLNPHTGIIAFFTAAILIFMVSIHEVLFFLCTNGPIGLSLGISNHYTKKRIVIAGLSSIVLTLTLCLMNYIIGINVFGTTLPGSLFIQFAILYCFSLVYCIVYLYLSNVLYNILNNFLHLDNKRI